jgi:hypothetical protein
MRRRDTPVRRDRSVHHLNRRDEPQGQGGAAVVYISVDKTARTAMERLAVDDGMDDRFPCWPRHEIEQVVELVPATS